MKTRFAAASLFLALFGAAPVCHTYAQSQGDMNVTAARDFEKADAELNGVFKKLIALLDDEGKKKLLASQRAWIVFRDAQATFDADAIRGGSAARGIYSSSREEMTKQRIVELKKSLKFAETEAGQ